MFRKKLRLYENRINRIKGVEEKKGLGSKISGKFPKVKKKNKSLILTFIYKKYISSLSLSSSISVS